MSKRRLTTIALAMACAGLGGGAAFAQGAGVYARAYGGLSTLNSTDVSFKPGLPGPPSTDKLSFDSGLLVGAALGYDFEGPWKAEIEYAYRSSDVRRLPVSLAQSGDFASTAIMVNGLYSFGEVGPLRPYVGAGAGFSPELDLDLTSSGPSAPPPSALGNYSRSGRFAYQGIAGAELPLTDRWTGFGEFRVFAIDSPSLRSSSKTLKADYQTIDLLVGVSRRF
ncbi:MAG: porin family protein [Phenylobacterium sp.]|uniref:outer membrane protein n=1 Tax=Phenylobacterium sp. TaxID=1871053 RepID=UPI0025FAD124|nr:outer membrane beta-barrel protein [Phenylobacterium sp.]MCA3712641.1 porin family protein [Phenylobacterium sp.]MCA3724118.1 porin family protein [Phenylobacterium sp.]MCA3726050.1 porin family protein [Phenylobacterium sp.]MCA6261929.1 porin family protein [Phenylobacterium sp.]MCA6283426.1 porin family protein [Phenylobacterium sp.]